MAIFGRSFPFPQRRINQLVGPASTVRATIVRPVRLADHGRPFPHVTIKTLIGPATTVKPAYVRARLPDRTRPFPHVTIKIAGAPNTVRATVVRPVKLPDRPRPKLGVLIGKALQTVTNVAMTADPGSFILTGIDAQFILSQFASAPVRAIRLPDRPRPFPHVIIKTLVGSATTVKPTYVRPIRLVDRPRPKLGVFIGKALPIVIRFGSIVRPVKLPDRPRPFPHVFIGKAILPVSATMAAGIGSFILTGIDVGLIGPPVVPLGLRWNLERAGWPHRRRKPTLLEILADIIEEDPPPKLAEKLSRRKKAHARTEAEQWAAEIVERAQRQAESYELEYAKTTIATALREHAKSLIDTAVERRLDHEDEEAILLLLSHYH